MYLWKSPTLTTLPKAWAARAGFPCFPGLCPDKLSGSPEMETPQLLWVTCASCQHSCTVTVNQGKRVFLCSDGISCASVCGHSFSSSHWALLKMGITSSWHVPSDFYAHQWGPPETCSSREKLFNRVVWVDPKRQMNYSSFKEFFKSRMLSFLVVPFELGFFSPFLIKMED